MMCAPTENAMSAQNSPLSPSGGPILLPLLGLLGLLALFTGCDAEPVADEDPLPDTAVDADEPVPDAAAPIDAAPPDAGPPPRACVWPGDCPDGDCIEGLCTPVVLDRCLDDAPCPEGEVCGGGQTRFYCALPCELDGTCPQRPRPCENKRQCAPGTNCKAGRCINDCTVDTDCAAGGHCVDGECMAFPDILGGTPLAGLGQGQSLLAGVGMASLDYPIGVSMAGYGGREGPQTPYNVVLGGSDRVFDHQDVRALALSTGDDTLIVLRLPLGWSTDYLRTRVATEVQRLTRSVEHPEGINVLDKLFTVATHSHSGPGRFWNVLPRTGLGVFGHGEFSPEMIDRYSRSFAAAVKRALDDLQPARFGYTIIDDFDPERRLHADRRGENPPFLDDRLMVWRIEDRDGNPLMGAINFAVHATHMQETWITGDVAGGMERVLTDRLSAEAGRPVPVMFLNGNAGNATPKADRSTSVSWGQIQAMGHMVWPVFRAAWQEAEPRETAQLEVVTRRIPISYDRLGYDRTVPDFRSELGDPYTYGGFSCVPEGRGEDDLYQDGMLGCRIDLGSFLGHPAMQVHKTAIGAFRIDDLVVTTLPGEPTSELGMLLAGWVEDDARNAGLPLVRALNFGYAQDHQLYLLTREDWFRGGYEASQNWFGWALGEYIAGEARLLARQLFTAERESNENGMQPTWFPRLQDDTVDPTPTLEVLGQFAVDAPARLARGQLLDVQWTGGHPAVDLPWVVLERLNERGGFQPVERSPGVIFDHKGFEALTVYSGNYGRVNRWSSRWELPFDFPLGVYRLRVVGKALQGPQVNPYDNSSRPFELVPARLAVHEWAVVDHTVRLVFTLPDGPTNDTGRNIFDGLRPMGHLLRVDPFWELDGRQRAWSFILGQPVADPAVTITVAGGAGPYAVDAQPTTVDRILVTGRAGDGAEETTVVPDWPAHMVEVELPGTGNYTVFVEDAWGNVGTLPISAEQNR